MQISFFSFRFSLLSFSLYLLPFIPFLSTEIVLASALHKTWKWNIDQLGDLAYFTTKFAPKIGHVFFWYSSGRIRSIFKMDTRMDGSVLAVLTAYQNNLVSSENDGVTSGSISPDFNVGKIRLLTRKS